MAKGFKVVRENSLGELISAVDTGGEIQYEENKWIKPATRRKGPLAVFANLACAQAFLKRQSRFDSTIHHIYECEYLASKGKNLFYTVYVATSRRYYRSVHPLYVCPDGTVFARQVKLTKKVG